MTTNAEVLARVVDAFTLTSGDDVVPSFPEYLDGFVDGNFDSWLSGTSFPLSTSGISFGYTADMWVAGCGDGAITVARGTRALGSAPTWTLGCSKYTADVTFTTPTTSNPALFGGRLERVTSLAGQSVTVSASLSSSAAVSITGIQVTQVFGSGGSPSSNVVSTTSVSWSVSSTEAKFSAKVAIPSVSGKTLGTSGGDFTQICLVFANGTTGTVHVSQIQLDTCPSSASAAGTPKPFRWLGLGLEKKRVERYLLTLTYPAGNNIVGGGATDASDVYAWGPIGTIMNKTPSVAVAAGSVHAAQAGGAYTESGAAAVSANSPQTLQFYSAGSGAVSGLFSWFYTSGTTTLLLDARI